MPLTTLTELEAVNRLLEMIEEAPANSLTNYEDDPDVGDAISHLRRAAFDFQAKVWAFNTIPSLTLTPASDGSIYVPSNVCSVPGYMILRDRKLYSISDATDEFTGQITTEATRLFDFDELPAEAAEYVFAVATESFLFNKAPGSQPPDRMKASAWASFHSFDLRLRDARHPQHSLIQNRTRTR